MANTAAVELAEELGVDFDSVKGTGVLGRKLVKDVQAAADAAAPESTTVELRIIPAGKSPPTTAFGVMADWSDDRVISVGRQALGDEFAVQADEITVTDVERTLSLATITGHVTE